MTEEKKLDWYRAGKRSRCEDECCENENCRKRIENELDEDEILKQTIIFYCSKIIREQSYYIAIENIAENKKEVKVSLKKLDWFKELDNNMQQNILYNLKNHIIRQMQDIPDS